MRDAEMLEQSSLSASQRDVISNLLETIIKRNSSQHCQQSAVTTGEKARKKKEAGIGVTF